MRMPRRRENIPPVSPVEISADGKTELVLGGGGIKGFGHIGLLRALEEQQVNLGTITGVSIGSIIATMYLNGYSPVEIQEIIYNEIVLAMTRPGAHPGILDAIYGVLSAPGLGNIKDVFNRIVYKYRLEPHPDLRIVAFSVLSAKPIVFEGREYDLASALASSCALPLLMRPVMMPRAGEGKPGLVLVDGGLHHPNPGEFCKGRAIIGKLGFASQRPTHELSRIDYLCHLLEQTSAALLDRYFIDPSGHVVIPVGMPDVSGLSFRLPKEKCLSMAEYGYRIALKRLEAELPSSNSLRHDAR